MKRQCRIRYQVVAALLLVFQPAYIYAENIKSTPPGCSQLYKGWVLNTIIAKACSLDPAPAYKLGVLIKDICNQELSENDRNVFSSEVIEKWKTDEGIMGIDSLCDEAKPSYKALNETLFSNE